MYNKIKIPENFQEAFHYVNDRYVFNEINYPALRRLNEDEAIIFSLKHTMLHMLKNIEPIEDFTDLHMWLRDHMNETHKASYVKMWINIFSLMNLFIVNDSEEIIEIESIETKFCNVKYSGRDLGELYSNTLKFIISLSKHLEGADHRGFIKINEGTIYTDFIDLVQNYYRSSKAHNLPFNIWQEIPNYMRSK
jgi:hypothetical protein